MVRLASSLFDIVIAALAAVVVFDGPRLDLLCFSA